jgi:hypothetical protein
VTAAGRSPISVVLGPCDEMRAEVFVRISGSESAGGRLVGTVTGPRRGRDTTLPTTSRLMSLLAGGEDSPVARAILTEPAYWTPDLPNLYRVDAMLESSHGQAHRIDETVGLRRLGIRGRSFWLDGRRWVPRAVVAAGPVDVAAFKAAALGAVLADAVDSDLGSADEVGLAIVPLVSPAELTAERIGGIARHPSAMLAVVRADTAAEPPAAISNRIAPLRRIKGTMLLGLTADGLQPPPQDPGSDFLVVMLPAGGLPHPAWRAEPSCPLVAWRRDPADTASGRAGCEALQRDLAAWGLAAGVDRLAWDWAGYLMG